MQAFIPQGSKWRDPLSLAILELQEKGTIQVHIKQAGIVFLSRQKNISKIFLIFFFDKTFMCYFSDALQQVVEEHGGCLHSARQEQRLKSRSIALLKKSNKLHILKT